ncbi:MAG: hypothetical protein K0S76_445 [Herbinix sp.]|jgi:5-methylcytosine-specific restriction endonuclease McrA|nr:hypothetical protein [Herbinix sp.]
MLKSCSSCGHIHDSKHICDQKQKLINERQKKFKEKNLEIYRFRNSKAWQDKREEIKERDLYICQICIRNLYGTTNQFTYDNTSVHHAIPLHKDFDKRLDNENLITTCEVHHEKMECGEIPTLEVLRIIKEQGNANVKR